MPFKPKLIPTLFTIPAMIALLTLGIWQLQRLEWKETLIDRLQTRVEADAIALPLGALDLEEWEFRRVTLTGQFQHDREVHLLNRSLNGNPGLHVLTPLQRADDPDGPLVLVNRGWVPFDRKDQSNRAEGLVDGQVTVNGIVRFQRPITGLQRVFLPLNEPANNIWYSADSDEITTALGTPVENFYVVDGNDAVPGTYPVGKQWSVEIRNDHLSYAITWFLLAAALAVIYVLYHRPQNGETD